MSDFATTATEPPVPATPAQTRGDGIGATIGKAVVTGAAIWGTYRFLDYLFAKPPEPIFLVLQEPDGCTPEEVDA
ncbi:MAG: hypothetical protein ACRBN8_19670 [Nannocystales bacterium]